MRYFKRIINTGLTIGLAVVLLTGAEIARRKKLYSRENMIIKIPDHMSALFIGDSRTMGLCIATDGGVDDNIGWIAEGGVKLDWYKEYAEPVAREKIGNCKKLVILLGVNDLLGMEFSDGENSDAADYAEILEETADKYSKKGVETYFVSVLPVDSSYDDINSDINIFNEKIEKSMNKCHYIDLYSPVTDNGFKTVDGLHFDLETSSYIFNRLMKELRRD